MLPVLLILPLKWLAFAEEEGMSTTLLFQLDPSLTQGSELISIPQIDITPEMFQSAAKNLAANGVDIES